MKPYYFLLLCGLLFSKINLHCQAYSYSAIELQLSNGNYEAACIVLQKHLVNQKEDHLANLQYGQCLIKLNEYEKAIEQLKLSKKALADNANFHFWYGQAYLSKLNNAQNFFERGIIASKVKEAFEQAVKLDSTNISARNSLVKYYLTAPSIAGGSLKKAIPHLDYVKSKNPRMGYYELANYYYRKKEYALARKEYEGYLKVATEKSEVLYLIGFVYQTEKDYQNAFAYFQKAIEEQPIHASALYQYARTGVFTKQNLDRSIQYLTDYIQQNGMPNGPDLASAY
ncbi:MAG: tetratricopeptide repeat protein, partial [Bacteroidota bacterium]